MRRILAPGPAPAAESRAPRIIASKRMNKLRERNGERPVMGSLQTLQQGRFSEYSYRQRKVPRGCDDEQRLTADIIDAPGGLDNQRQARAYLAT
jgi:hypothetical protein